MPASQKRLKIAMIAPPWLSLYPGCFYGIENVVHNLTESLTVQGHHVELFSVGGTTTHAAKKYWYHKEEQYKYIHKPYYETVSIIISHILYALNIIREAGDFDIIHDHNNFLGPAIMCFTDSGLPPILHTLHDPFTNDKLLAKGIPDNKLMFAQFGSAKQLYFNGVSNAQLSNAPQELEKLLMGAIYNGVDLNEFPFVNKKDDYFLSVGNISRDKGQGVGAKLCSELDVRFIMAGTVAAGISTPKQLTMELADPVSQYRNDEQFKYFSDKILPYLEPNRIEYIGITKGKQKLDLFSNAKAFLSPVDRDEPFGIAIIEALACGTPVIAYRRGALPEIIQHGVNGFLADNEKEFKGYMQRVEEIDPAACRKSVEDYFSYKVMTDKYVDLYHEIIQKNAAKPFPGTEN